MYLLFTPADTAVGLKFHSFIRPDKIIYMSFQTLIVSVFKSVLWLQRETWSWNMILQSLLHLYAHHSTFDFIATRHVCNCVHFKQHNQKTPFILCRCLFYNTAVWFSAVGLEDTLVSLNHLSSPRRALDSRHHGNAIVCDEVTLVAILTCESRVVGCGTVPPGVAHVAIVRRDVGAVAILRGKLMMRELPHVHVGVGCHDGGGCTSTGTGCRWNVADNSATPTGTAAGTATAGAAAIRRWWCPGSGQF